MSFLEKLKYLRSLFNQHTIKLVEQPHIAEMTPLDLPPLSYDDTPPTELEKRAALQQFHAMCTQEFIEIVADELSIKQLDYSPKLREITDLVSVFDNSETIEEYPNMTYFMGQAIRYRDAELVNMTAEEMYVPYSQLNNTQFSQKMEAICTKTANPALRLVR